MKNFIRWTLALAAACLAAQAQSALHAQIFSQGAIQSVVLTIHPDGRCEVESRSLMGRAVVEQQVKLMERMQIMEEAGDADGMAQIAGVKPDAKTNVLTDEQLKEKYLETMEGQFFDPEDEAAKPNLTLDKDNLTVRKKSSFASIHEMLENRSGLREAADLIYFENMRFEQDTNSHLLVTLTPAARMKRETKNMRTEWKVEGLNAELKLVFPGKVLSSGFPKTETNATWIAVDSKKDETLDALVKLYDGPIVITAEAAGLTLKEPLELKNLQPRWGRGTGEMGGDLPITEAGPGFVAQAEGIETTTVHIFPAGENYFKQGNNPYGQQAGTMVHAKLFPPKGRTLQSVTDVKLLQATDDKGRAVTAGENDGEEEFSTAYVQAVMGGTRENNSADIQLRLQLPQPDAQAIDELSAEAVAVTAGSWQELTLTNINETATNEFDLGGVLPGAKLVISKFSNKNYMLRLQVRIKGAATVKNLKVEVKIPGSEERSFSNSSEMSVKTTGGVTTRNISINASTFDGSGAKSTGPFDLLIRYPQDLKGERVNFKLKGLDLL